MLDVLYGWAQRLLKLAQAGWAWVRDLYLRVVARIESALFPQAPRRAAPAPPQPAPAPGTAATAPASPPEAAGDVSDENALGRLLASEDRSRDAKIVIGWITVQRQRARRQTLYQFLTRGLGYGPQDRRAQKQGVMYASTAKPATASDLELARGLLSGEVKPSAAIRAHKPGAWVERGQGVTDDKILMKQADWKEGIYGRVTGTRWLLFSADTPKIATKPGQSSAQALDAVPEVPGVDSVSAVAAA